MSIIEIDRRRVSSAEPLKVCDNKNVFGWTGQTREKSKSFSALNKGKYSNYGFLNHKYKREYRNKHIE